MRTDFLDALDLDRLLDGCWRSRWPLALALLLSLCGLWYWVAIGPTMRQLNLLESEHEQRQSSLVAQRQLVAALPSMRARKGRLGDALVRAAARLPNQAELAGLLVDVSQAGIDAGLTFERFQPSDSLAREFYEERPIRLAVRGDYHQLGRFLEALAALPRLVSLSDFEVRAVGADKTNREYSLRLEAMLMTYRVRAPLDALSDDGSEVEAAPDMLMPASMQRIDLSSVRPSDAARLDLGMPSALVVEPVRYLAGASRDPFTWPRPIVKTARETHELSLPQRPPAHSRRPRQPLEQFSLDQLQMVGRLDGGSRRWALVSAPDGHVHVVEPGDYLGRDRGRVEAIAQDEILLIERIADGAGNWRNRETRLGLQP